MNLALDSKRSPDCRLRLFFRLFLLGNLRLGRLNAASLGHNCPFAMNILDLVNYRLEMQMVLILQLRGEVSRFVLLGPSEVFFLFKGLQSSALVDVLQAEIGLSFACFFQKCVSHQLGLIVECACTEGGACIEGNLRVSIFRVKHISGRRV